MNKIVGVITAMSSEYEQLSNMMVNRKENYIAPYTYLEGQIGELNVILLQCGIGKVNAAMGASLLIERFRPDAVISTGVAGGAAASLHIMDVVVSTKCAYHDIWCGPGTVWGEVQGLPRYFESDSTLVQAALSIDTDVRVVAGLICTGDLFVSKQEERERIIRLHPETLAVDMESAAISHVCHLSGIPFVSFRIISDTPGEHPDNASQYVDFWQTMADKSFLVTKTFLSQI
ncbi:MAG: 5'-methylthioadenosine/adenosylhomocysteine nucleosidase [Bacteroidales bacterium]|nr:5'-methylthioadenosine/adenosylhomocysteine nucleosidase [Candidatus Physcousia equi]